MDLFSEIHMKSRSTQAYCVDAFWVIMFFIYARCHNKHRLNFNETKDLCAWHKLMPSCPLVENS